MIYGVKVIHTFTVGENDRRFYEELILTVKAESFDEAYEKAERHMQDYICEYTNPYGETVKTLKIDAIDCFHAYDPDGDVQEVFSTHKTNQSFLSEDAYYKILTYTCDEEELRPLRDRDFNGVWQR